MATKIIVTVRGGLVTNVHAPDTRKKLEVVVIDYREKSADQDEVKSLSKEDAEDYKQSLKGNGIEFSQIWI